MSLFTLSLFISAIGISLGVMFSVFGHLHCLPAESDLETGKASHKKG